MPERSFFLSDLHIGDGSSPCLYQSRYHEADLRTILRYLYGRRRDIRDLVLLGDIFDPLAVPPDRRPFTVAEAITANPGLFEEGNGGDFISLFGSMRGTVTYVNGNHDQFVSVDAINAVLEGRCGRRVAGNADPVANAVFRSGNILAEHGHFHSLLFRPASHRSADDPPFGSYVSRILAEICARKLAESGAACAPELEGAGEPVLSFASAAFAAKELMELALGKEELAEALLDQFLFFAGTDRSRTSFTLEDGSERAASSIPAAHRDLWRRAGEDLAYLVADATNSLQRAAEERIATEAPIVIMGHTHGPLLVADHYPREGVYANTGFGCPDCAERASGKKMPTFVEVEHHRNREVVLLKGVDPGGSVSTLNRLEYAVRRR